MKTARILFALGLASATRATAQAGFPVQAQAVVTPYQISVAFQNPYGAPIACEGRVWATTNYLGSGWLQLSTGVIYPWQWGSIALVPPYGNIFIAGQAWVFCQYL